MNDTQRRLITSLEVQGRVHRSAVRT